MVKSLYSVFKNIDDIGLDGTPKKRRKKRTVKPKKVLKSYPVDKTKKFHKNKHHIPSVIFSTIDNKEIIYGEHALKARFPNYLERPTTDYDVYSKTPHKSAREAEQALDKKFGGDFFYTKQAQHPGTYKVVAHANNEGYADFTKPEKKIPYDVIRGKKYAKLKLEKQHRMKSLKDPNYAWRHGKDRDAYNRIIIYERMKQLKGRKR